MTIKPYLCAGCLIATLIGQSIAHAEVYKCPRSDGSVTLSNVEKGAGCSKMVLPPPTTPKKSATPVAKEAAVKEGTKAPDKPKSTYDTAATERKRVIQEEMDLERSRLNTVQARIKDLSANPSKTPDQVKEMVTLQQKESMHASNIQLLQKELNR